MTSFVSAVAPARAPAREATPPRPADNGAYPETHTARLEYNQRLHHWHDIAKAMAFALRKTEGQLEMAQDEETRREFRDACRILGDAFRLAAEYCGVGALMAFQRLGILPPKPPQEMMDAAAKILRSVPTEDVEHTYCELLGRDWHGESGLPILEETTPNRE
ncbi:MAG: hypothetical protein NZM07_09755 [Elioraea sp.]|nr:hypothetical protein [Elioraea sp.]